MIKNNLKNMICGMCMAAADSVPGVSGGSVAYLMGFYRRLVDAVEGLTSLRLERVRPHVPFLVTLGLGWAAGFGLCVSVLSAFFKQDIYGASSLFLGFTAAATVVLLSDREVRSGWNVRRVGCLILGAAAVCTAAQFGVISRFTFQLMSPDLLTGGLLFLIGAAAISAMILPGISGSTILLIFGLYVPIIDAVKSLLQLDFRYVPALMFFVLGLWIGITVFIRFLKRQMADHGTAVKFGVAGMVIGSLYAIVVGPLRVHGYGGSILSLSNFQPLLFLVGALGVLALELFKHRSEIKGGASKLKARKNPVLLKASFRRPLSLGKRQGR